LAPLRPVQPGQTLYAGSTIGKVRGSRSRPTQGVAEVQTRGYVASGELSRSYQRALLVYRRNVGPYAAAGF
jgi:itaconyl-CoA hydratase